MIAEGGLIPGCLLWSRQIYSETFEVGERAVSQCSGTGSAQDHARRLVCFECFLPAGYT